MKTAVIMQSNYIPWRGYFDLISSADVFVIYDCVQYTKNDWRNRNQIKTKDGLQWLTVPVSCSGKKSIFETPIVYDKDWARSHLGSLKASYMAAKHFQPYFEEFSEILNRGFSMISELNVALLRWTCEKLSIRTPFVLSSELPLEGKSTDRVIRTLNEVGANRYISGPAGRNYLEHDKFFEAGISLEYKSYEYPEYPQFFGPFIGTVTILDLLFNVGPQAQTYLTSRAANQIAVDPSNGVVL